MLRWSVPWLPMDEHDVVDTTASDDSGPAADVAGERWWRRWLRVAVPSGSGFESTRYVTKWLLLGGAIGVVAGLGAITFYAGIQFVTEVLLGRLVGYMPPAPAGEGAARIVFFGRPWLLPLVTAAGGLLSGLLVFGLAPEAEGHGTDAAIDAIHHKGGYIRARIPPIKLIASALTIGSGGSGGREGPAAQISAGFGSLLGRWLHLDVQDRRIAVAAGMGAGIGAIFRAPLGGAVLAAEIMYLHDIEVEALLPALIAAIVGYTVYGAFFGFTPIFGPHTALALGAPIQLLYYAILGLLCGVMGILYARIFYGAVTVSHRVRLPNWLKPAIGGLLVGLLGLVLPGALHMGYGWVQLAMGQTLLALPLWAILALPFAKILATSLSIGTGGSGGIFGPGMVIGGIAGASFWRLAHGVLPAMPAQPSSFVIIGMMALFGGIAHAPLAVMLMVAEMTGNLSLLAPAMVAVAVSTALVGNNTIYRSQLPNRSASPVHRLRFSFPLLSSLLVRDAMQAPVQGSPGPTDLMLVPDEPLDSALERMTRHEISAAPVVSGGAVVGELRVRDVVHAYRSALQRGFRRADSLPPNTTLLEIRIGEHSPLARRTLADAGLPRGTLIVSVAREGETFFPHANTAIKPGDEVMILADPQQERALRAFLLG